MYFPTVTIIVRACNVSRFLPAALTSILDQDFADWETLILDDASEDATASAAAPFVKRDARFIYIRNIRRLGRARNLNLGLSQARGEFTCVLDGDDRWCVPHALRTVVLYLREHPNTALVAGNVAEVNERDEVIRQFPHLWQTDRDIKSHLLVENIIAQNSVCFRTSLVRDLAGYDERLQFTEDYELWLRLGRCGNMRKIPETLGWYRMHGRNVGVRCRRRQIVEELRVVWRYRHAYPHFALAVANRLVNLIASFIPKPLRHFVAHILNYHDKKAKLLASVTKRKYETT